ncbi:macro domain-containing protein [Chryseobacterium binzhouense]|uniref:macro domain-containing protein n=1 Tax=Chryseobacterium binzhouense TaxID=2593646 RepID=UPI00117E7BC5|nr:macro domain-containing protein [Chryseobacterium binzhouense]
MKVKFLDKNVRSKFWFLFSVISGVLSFILLFNIIPEEHKNYLKYLGYLSFGLLILAYFGIWIYANKLTNININIDGSNVNIKCGDLFLENGLKTIPFNEFFDTIVDDKIISQSSLNGIFIDRFFQNKVYDLDNFIATQTDNSDVIDNQFYRKKGGKNVKFKLSTIFVYNDFVITAFAKFDEYNRATLTMPEYIEFLINFWDRINRVYAQKNVSVPVFGSGITRLKEHKNINDEDLLKIMIWTFKLSEMKFKYPAKLTIVIHKDKIDQINLFNLKSIESGL